MIGHSFSAARTGFNSYCRFLEILGLDHHDGALTWVALPDGRQLYLGWAIGDQKYRSAHGRSIGHDQTSSSGEQIC
jgi:hypothetical protein